MNLELYVKQVEEAVSYIKDIFPEPIDIGIILGTGLSGLENKLADTISVAYSDIPHFPTSTAPSHRGQLIIGKLFDKTVLCLSGRLHWYEGYSMREVTFPIRIMGVLGVPKLIVTNAAGGISEAYDQGDLVFIRDHINLFPDNPLRGQNNDKWGDRFPDMSVVYDKSALAIGSEICDDLSVTFKAGVYCGFPGPNLETPAEYGFLHQIGGHLVGMSTVPEVLVARHMGIAVLGISLVTNACYPPDRIEETSVEDVIAMAQSRQAIFIELVSRIVDKWTKLKLIAK